MQLRTIALASGALLTATLRHFLVGRITHPTPPGHPCHGLSNSDWTLLMGTRSISLFFFVMVLLAVALGAAVIAIPTIGAA